MSKAKKNSSRTVSGRAGPWARLPRKCLNCGASTQSSMEDANNRKLNKFSLWPHYEYEDGTKKHALFCFDCGFINNVELITLEEKKFRFIYREDEDGEIFYPPDPEDLFHYFKENKNDPEINEYINSLAYRRMIIRGYLPKDTGAKELIQKTQKHTAIKKHKGYITPRIKTKHSSDFVDSVSAPAEGAFSLILTAISGLGFLLVYYFAFCMLWLYPMLWLAIFWLQPLIWWVNGLGVEGFVPWVVYMFLFQHFIYPLLKPLFEYPMEWFNKVLGWW